jgi:hypothetical protein
MGPKEMGEGGDGMVSLTYKGLVLFVLLLGTCRLGKRGRRGGVAVEKAFLT